MQDDIGYGYQPAVVVCVVCGDVTVWLLVAVYVCVISPVYSSRCCQKSVTTHQGNRKDVVLKLLIRRIYTCSEYLVAKLFQHGTLGTNLLEVFHRQRAPRVTAAFRVTNSMQAEQFQMLSQIVHSRV